MKKTHRIQANQMELLSTEQANSLLSKLGLTIGQWNEVTAESSSSRTSGSSYEMHKAPSGAHSLYTFARHVAGWLPSGDWKLIQVDNSTSLNVITAAPIARLLYADDQLHSPDDVNRASIKFAFGSDRRKNAATEILVSELIYYFLLLECHVQVVSSACQDGQFLSIQDGFVYFKFGRGDLARQTSELLRSFEASPEQWPSWLVEIAEEME
jgi:hypothetical protein